MDHEGIEVEESMFGIWRFVQQALFENNDSMVVRSEIHAVVWNSSKVARSTKNGR